MEIYPNKGDESCFLEDTAVVEAAVTSCALEILGVFFGGGE
jgi:hypothetical protein